MTTCLVVGAAGGVGLEVVRLLVARGDTVIATVLDAAEAGRLRNAVPGVAEVAEIDLADGDGIGAALAALFARSGDHLDAVAVCAAVAPFGPLETMPLAGLRRTLEINAVADVAVYQATMPLMRRSKGRYVFIVSFAGRLGIPFLGHYVASKYALEGLGDVMRREAAKWDVSVSLIECGGIKTKMVYDQIALIERQSAALSDQQRHLYGDLYAAFDGFLRQVEGAMPPQTVATAVIGALDAVTPLPRYQVGPDAVQLVEMARTGTDAQIDTFYRDLFFPKGYQADVQASVT